MNKIRELRKEKKLSQGDLAKELNTSTSNISGWECGKWQPDNDTLINLADFFGVSIDYLLGQSEYFYPDTVANNTEEQEIISNYRQLDYYGKKLVKQTLETLLAKPSDVSEETSKPKKKIN